MKPDLVLLDALSRRRHMATCVGMPGLDRFDRHFDSLQAHGAEMIARAHRGVAGGCLRENSHIRLIPGPRRMTYPEVVALDIGGTRIKAAHARCREFGDPEWTVLFDLPNEALRGESSGSLPLNRLFMAIAQRMRRTLDSRNLGMDAAALIWSNQMTTIPIEAGTGLTGVTALVSGVGNGTYRKEEWFIEGLRDGFDLGGAFSEAITAVDLIPRCLVIGNDTVFTVGACRNSRAGVVVSSGANCTIGDVEADGATSLFNSELGSLLLLDDWILSEGDLALAKQLKERLALENIIAGKWLGRLLECHIRAGACEGIPDFRAIEDHPGSRNIETEFLSLALADPQALAARFHGIDARILVTVRTLMERLVRRAARGSALLCYFSVLECASREESVTVTIDSSVARNIPGYYAALEERFRELVSSHKCQTELVLARPLKLDDEHDISVPLQGAVSLVSTWTS